LKGIFFLKEQDVSRYDDGIVDAEAGVAVEDSRARGEVAPAMGLLLGGEAVPGVPRNGFFWVNLVLEGEPVAREALPSPGR
jgi:hypothetical protein